MAGTVTKLGPLGADAQLCYLKKLPDFYVTKKDALKSGWKRALGNLNDVLPGKSIGGDIFYNDLGKLPSEASRVWREADFDYIRGYSRKESNTIWFIKRYFRPICVKTSRNTTVLHRVLP